MSIGVNVRSSVIQTQNQNNVQKTVTNNATNSPTRVTNPPTSPKPSNTNTTPVVSNTALTKTVLKRSISSAISQKTPISQAKVNQFSDLKNGVQQIIQNTPPTQPNTVTQTNNVITSTRPPLPPRPIKTPPPLPPKPTKLLGQAQMVKTAPPPPRTKVGTTTVNQNVHSPVVNTVTAKPHTTTLTTVAPVVTPPPPNPKIKFNKTDRNKITSELNTLDEYKTVTPKKTSSEVAKEAKGIILNIVKQAALFSIGKNEEHGSDGVSSNVGVLPLLGKLSDGTGTGLGSADTLLKDKFGEGLTGHAANTNSAFAVIGSGLGSITGVLETSISGFETVSGIHKAAVYSKISKELTTAANDPNISPEEKVILKKFATEAKNISRKAGWEAFGNSLKTTANAASTLASMTGLAASIASLAVDSTAQVITGAVGAAAGGFTGIISIGLGTFGMVKDIISVVKSSKLNSKAVNFQQNPPQALADLSEKKIKKLDKQISKLDKQIKNLEKNTTNPDTVKIQQLKDEKAILETKKGEKNTKLIALKKDANEFKTASPSRKDELKNKYGVTNNLDAIARQTVSRTGVGNKIFKALSITNNAINILGGTVSTAGLIATATGVGAPVGAILCPIGWAISGASAVGSIGLGSYKMGKTIHRVKIANDLDKQDKQVTKMQTNINDQLATERSKSQPDTAKISKLEADLDKTKKLKNDITVQRNRQDPKVAVQSLMNTLNKPIPTSPPASAEEVQAVKSEVKAAKFMLRNVYQVKPDLLKEIPTNITGKEREKAEKIQNHELAKLENKINYFG